MLRWWGVFLFVLSSAEARPLGEVYLRKDDRIGVVVDRFDPPHRRDQSFLEQVLREGNVDYLILLPSFGPTRTSASKRFEMLSLLFESHPRILIPGIHESRLRFLQDFRKFYPENPLIFVCRKRGLETQFQKLLLEPDALIFLNSESTTVSKDLRKAFRRSTSLHDLEPIIDLVLADFIYTHGLYRESFLKRWFYSCRERITRLVAKVG